MRAYTLLQGASYAPDKLAFIRRAFDEAWEEIAAQYAASPFATEAAHLELAHAILQHAPTFGDDLEALKRAALQQVGASPP